MPQDTRINTVNRKAVFAQRMSASGETEGEAIRVDVPDGQDHRYPSVAGRPGGGFAVIWEQDSLYQGRSYDAAGLGGEPFEIPRRALYLLQASSLAAWASDPPVRFLIVVELFLLRLPAESPV